MSTPTRSFETLNIGGMPPTRRSQTQARQQRAGRSAGGRPRGRGRRRGDDIDPSAPHIAAPVREVEGPIHGSSGLLYNIQNLSPGSSRRAVEGLASEFFVDRLKCYGLGSDAYYAFQLKKPVSVRIHDPASGARKVECTCDDYQQSRSICAHIYWLFDGLSAVLTNQTAEDIRTLSQGDVVAQISELYDLIGDRVDTLPDRLNLTRGNDADYDSDGSITPESSYTASDALKESVRDMLSVFDSAGFPEEHGQTFQEAAATASLEDLFVPGNLSATIYGLAIRDASVYKRLTKVITPDRCASNYYAKQRARAEEAMRSLGRYIRDGPSPNPATQDMDVPECARTFRMIVHQICQDRDSRTAKQPLSAAVITKVAEILVEILQEVCNRDIDVYENITWPRVGAIDEPERDRNLYMYLIGDPPRDPSAPAWMNDDFVIDQLLNFPTNEWRHLVEPLTTLREEIYERAVEYGLPSIDYAAKLEAMLREYTNEAEEPSTSSVQRRLTLESPRERQRRRMA